MAFDNIEIEIKAEVSFESFLKAKDTLLKIANFNKISEQLDIYYSPLNNEGYLGKEEYPFKWFSIRQRNGIINLNYKHYFPEFAEKHTHCDEYEVVVSSLENAESIFLSLGMKKVASVQKRREIYTFLDLYEIALDEVKGLGYFIEVEALKDQGGIIETRNKVIDFFTKMDVKDYKMDYRGYPFLVVERGLDNENSNH